jgi:organic hydroperoxide reductase OsmC/OhrA
MGIVKTHRYEIGSRWITGRRLELASTGKPTLEVATPPNFKDGVHGVWSPEELLVGSLATCLELTLIAIAEHRRVPLTGLAVAGMGQLERREGRFRFALVELDVEAETDAAHADELEELVRLAKDHCIVGDALTVPVVLRVDVRVPKRPIATAA